MFVEMFSLQNVPAFIVAALCVVVLPACSERQTSDDNGSFVGKDVSNNGASVIEIGPYVIHAPPDFELVEERSIDSYVGSIKGDSLTIWFDFGYYSNSLAPSVDEYLTGRTWVDDAVIRFMEPGVTYDHRNMPVVEVLGMRPATAKDSSLGEGCDFVASCKHEYQPFDYPIYLPTNVKAVNVEVDTLHGYFRKIVMAKDPLQAATGIYLKDLSSFNESMNASKALSMVTTGITKQQQSQVLEIFKSITTK
mgnify:CR=1 FL=1